MKKIIVSLLLVATFTQTHPKGMHPALMGISLSSVPLLLGNEAVNWSGTLFEKNTRSPLVKNQIRLKQQQAKKALAIVVKFGLAGYLYYLLFKRPHNRKLRSQVIQALVPIFALSYSRYLRACAEQKEIEAEIARLQAAQAA